MNTLYLNNKKNLKIAIALREGQLKEYRREFPENCTLITSLKKAIEDNTWRLSTFI